MLAPLELDGPSYSVPNLPPKPPPTLRHTIFVAWVTLSRIFLLWVASLWIESLAQPPAKLTVTSLCAGLE